MMAFMENEGDFLAIDEQHFHYCVWSGRWSRERGRGIM
jgi:hypothetical protein